LNLTWGLVIIIIVNVATAAFVYGRLTERVKTIGDRTISHGTRLDNVENVQGGTGGHGERITGLEAWREESRNRRHE
jgi:hypothetical protein